MNVINSILNFLLGLPFLPFQWMNPWVGLVVVSLASGILLIWLFKMTSNQKAISRAKNLLNGYMLEIRLFKDDPGIVFAAFGRVLWSNIIYMRYAITPMLFMLLPVVLLLIQADMRYGVRPVEPGERILLTVALAGEMGNGPEAVALKLPAQVKIAAGPVRVASGNEISWELEVSEKGNYAIGIDAGGGRLAVPLKADGIAPAVGRVMTAGSVIDRLMNPAYPAPPGDSGVKRIEVGYPAREMKAAGITVHWLITFFAVSVIFGLSVKGLFGVEI